MNFEYTFIAEIEKPAAFESYLQNNLAWVANYQGNSINTLDNNVKLYSDRELTPLEQSDTTTLIDNYEDPEVFLIFEHGETTPMNTLFTDEVDLTVGGKKVLQTFIFNIPQNEEETVLGSFKTVVEYNCPDTQAFGLISNASIDMEIYDCSRDVQVFQTTISLAEIETKWQGMNLAPENDTVFRSAFIGGLQYQLPSHDCVWQIRVSTSHPEFKVRLNSLQQLFYTVE